MVIGRKQYVFHNILHVFHVGDRVCVELLNNVNGADSQLFSGFQVKFARGFRRFGDGLGNFFRVKLLGGSVSFYLVMTSAFSIILSNPK